MTDREPLVALIKEGDCSSLTYGECSRCKYGCKGDCSYQFLADHLLANGVVVREWIPVTERLPEPFVSVLVQMPYESPLPTVREGFISADGSWYGGLYQREPDEVTHWMPMPEPPKEGE